MCVAARALCKHTARRRFLAILWRRVWTTPLFAVHNETVAAYVHTLHHFISRSSLHNPALYIYIHR